MKLYKSDDLCQIILKMMRKTINSRYIYIFLSDPAVLTHIFKLLKHKFKERRILNKIFMYLYLKMWSANIYHISVAKRFSNCTSFYPSTFVYNCFPPKIQFLYCLHSSVAPGPMVDTEGKIFEIQVCRSLENAFFLGFS